MIKLEKLNKKQCSMVFTGRDAMWIRVCATLSGLSEEQVMQWILGAVRQEIKRKQK